jgi:hypothetical protein
LPLLQLPSLLPVTLVAIAKPFPVRALVPSLLLLPSILPPLPLPSLSPSTSLLPPLPLLFAITLFVACHLVAVALACVVAIAIARWQWQGNKNNGGNRNGGGGKYNNQLKRGTPKQQWQQKRPIVRMLEKGEW